MLITGDLGERVRVDRSAFFYVANANTSLILIINNLSIDDYF